MTVDAGTVLHIVMDAYRGDVVSLPGRLEVVGGGGEARITVRVRAGEAMPQVPRAAAWHVRFVGPNRALDARTSDGTLTSLVWDDEGVTLTLDIGDELAALDVRPGVAATRVTHVLVVPESPLRQG